MQVQIVGFVVSPRHRYSGRPADGPLPATGPEQPTEIALRAGLGVVGDRYFGQRAHRDASVTLIAIESLEAVADELGVARFDPAAARRTIVLRGADVDGLVRREFVLDAGHGPIRFAGHRPANPCGWMDVVLAPGAFRALRGRGGVRCTPLDDGLLQVGTARLTVAQAPPV